MSKTEDIIYNRLAGEVTKNLDLAKIAKELAPAVEKELKDSFVKAIKRNLVNDMEEAVTEAGYALADAWAKSLMENLMPKKVKK